AELTQTYPAVGSPAVVLASFRRDLNRGGQIVYRLGVVSGASIGQGLVEGAAPGPLAERERLRRGPGQQRLIVLKDAGDQRPGVHAGHRLKARGEVQRTAARRHPFPGACALRRGRRVVFEEEENDKGPG